MKAGIKAEVKVAANKPTTLVISGPVGVGKTTVGNEVSTLLEGRGVAHTFVDLDALRQTFPGREDDAWNNALGLDNLALVWENGQAAGARNLVLATVVETHDFIAELNHAIPGTRIVTCQLEARPDTLAGRVRQREIGSDLDWHVRRSGELCAILAQSSAPADLRIDTEGRGVADIAAELLHRVTWRA